MPTRSLQPPFSTRPTAAASTRSTFALRRFTSIAPILILAGCSESGSGTASSADSAAQSVDDAGARDGGAEDGGLVCADPATAAEADTSLVLGPAFSTGMLQGGSVSVRDDEGTTGVVGTATLVQSQIGADGPLTTPADLRAPPGKLCLSGSTVIVPLMNFTDYWGAGIRLYLSTVPRAQEAGGDAGVADESTSSIEAYSVLPWDPAPGGVVGFSFVVEANDAELSCGGLPPLLRVQTLPAGGIGQLADIHCKDFTALSHGGRLDMLFSDVTRECWDGGGRAIFADPLPAGYSKQIYDLFFVVPAGEVETYSFDLCISDIRPILGP